MTVQYEFRQWQDHVRANQQEPGDPISGYFFARVRGEDLASVVARAQPFIEQMPEKAYYYVRITTERVEP